MRTGNSETSRKFLDNFILLFRNMNYYLAASLRRISIDKIVLTLYPHTSISILKCN